MSVTLDSCVRGFHIYQNIWNPLIGENLTCQPEFGNIHDLYSVAVVASSSSIVGHVPRSISALCTFFIRRGGTIVCQVTGRRRYSSDLVQGGLEIPCTYTFSGGDVSRLIKVEKLLSKAPVDAGLLQEPPSKTIDLCNTKEMDTDCESEQVWLSVFDCFLTLSDREMIMNAEKQLNDRHINFSQRLLLQQFPGTEGLKCTLLQNKILKSKIKCGIQIIHDRGNHWLVASTIDSVNGNVVKIYDSVYSSVHEETKLTIQCLFELAENPEYNFMNMQKQVGGCDCGLFSIAVATALLQNDTEYAFCQSKMRRHLLSCLEIKYLSSFPSYS